jgi:RNA polymerase sigma-70 factor (ECF subfamily)
MVFSLAYHFVRDRAIAEELARDVFLELYRHLGDLLSAAHVMFWLRRVTSRRCIDQRRRAFRRREVPIADVPEPAVAVRSGDPLRQERLRRLVGELPAAARMVVILRYQEDLDPLEISRILGMRINTVKSHLRRAIALLRSKMMEEEARR